MKTKNKATLLLAFALIVINIVSVTPVKKSTITVSNRPTAIIKTSEQIDAY